MGILTCCSMLPLTSILCTLYLAVDREEARAMVAGARNWTLSPCRVCLWTPTALAVSHGTRGVDSRQLGDVGAGLCNLRNCLSSMTPLTWSFCDSSLLFTFINVDKMHLRHPSLCIGSGFSNWPQLCMAFQLVFLWVGWWGKIVDKEMCVNPSCYALYYNKEGRDDKLHLFFSKSIKAQHPPPKRPKT